MSHRDSSPECAAPTLDDLCGNAIKLQVAGRLELAEQLYRRILQAEPAHAAANHCIGMLNVQLRRPADGLPHLLAALESNPQNPDYWLGYLEALLLAGRTEDAKDTLALGLQHGLTGASALDFAQRLEARLSQSTVKELPTTPAGPATSAGPPASPQPRRADRRRESRLAQKQEDSLLTLVKQGKFAEGLALARTLTERFAERGLAWKTLGALLWAEGRKDDALAAMQTSARLMPQDAEARCNLGATLIKFERFDEAETHLQAALEIDPGCAAAHIHIGDGYQLQGRNAEAEASVRRAIALRTDDASDDRLLYSSLLYLLSQDPATDADALFAEHCRIGEIFEAPLRASWPRHPNDPDPDRCLKVGLVSGDLCNHAVAHFIEPVLAELRDYPSLELHAYYTNVVEDTVSRRLRGYFKDWHRVAALSDIQMMRKIMDDHIDILIDLSGHTSLNRLRAFARAATVPVINGLSDGGHPVQILADLFTVEERLGGVEGKTLAFVGDCASNMALSFCEAAPLFGFSLRLAAPDGYRPPASALRGAKLTADAVAAVQGADVIITDVWISMGQEKEAAARKAALGNFIVDEQLMRHASPRAIVLHCLPAHRGEEIAAAVIDGPQSAVFDEAENRLHLQKALLEQLILRR